MLNVMASEIMPFSSAIAGTAAGRVSLPVAKGQAIYAHFEHVSGVPTEGGVSVDRLKLLDTLIDRLSALERERGKRAEPAKADYRGLAPEKLDSLIGQYRDKIQAAAPAPYRPAAFLPQALVFSVLA